MTTLLPVGPASDMDARTLERVRRLVMQMAGIMLGSNKASMVRARLSKRLAATGHVDISDYLDFVERGDDPAERSEFISVMTTNVTHFFREAHHFDRLAEIAAQTRRTGQPLKVWSAACSSGPEPYSIAMTLAEARLSSADARILATDIDQKILAKAIAGTYPMRELHGTPPALLAKYVSTAPDGGTMVPALKAMIDFKPLNLTASWPFRTQFDVIFCRNVAIYFDAPTQHVLWSRLISVLKPGGHLFIGHSERLTEDLLGSMTYLGQTSYRKSATPNPKDGAP